MRVYGEQEWAMSRMCDALRGLSPPLQARFLDALLPVS